MTPSEIRAARKSLALTQGQLATVLHLGKRGQSTVSEWERGVCSIGASNALLLRAYLDGYRPADWPLPPAPTTGGATDEP